VAVSKRVRRVARNTLLYAVLSALGVLFMLPLLWMLSTSIKPDSLIFVFPPVWVPRDPDWGHYPAAVAHVNFGVLLRNSVVITCGNIALSLVSCSLVAYAFARLRWPGRDAFFVVMLSTMMLPPEVTLVPIYIAFRQLGLINTLWPLIIPAAFGSPFLIFLLRQFFLSIPAELSDAAKIDGANELRTLVSIVLPLSKPALMTVAIFQFTWRWNDFLLPLIYLTRNDLKTLALGLQMFVADYGTDWGPLMAISVMVLLPVLVLFFVAQEYFIEGVTLTGLNQ